MNYNYITSSLGAKAVQKFEAVQQLSEVVNNSGDVLAKATTVFPFTMFPDAITVDREKITVTHRTFFRIAEVTSIRIEDILNVTSGVGPFFGTLKISTRYFDTEKPPYTIRYLTRSDTQHIKRLLQGYITAMRKKIDTSALNTDELSDMLDQLGGGEAETD
jgi:hypothetical protein